MTYSEASQSLLWPAFIDWYSDGRNDGEPYGNAWKIQWEAFLAGAKAESEATAGDPV